MSPTKDLMGTLEQQARALQQQALKLREKELREVPQDGDGLWLRTRNLQYIVRVLIDAADNLLSLAGVNVALAIEEAVE